MVRTRALLVWLVVSGVAVVVARWSATSLPVAEPGHFDDVLVSVSALLLIGCAAWAWVVTTVVVAQGWRSGGQVRAARGVPAWAVRVVAAACGLAIVGGGAAHASYDVDPAPRAPSSIDGLPFPDRATGPDHMPTARPAHGPAVAELVVRPGDSLWRLSAARLGPGATDAEVAAATRALHEHNRDVVGPDPDLIHPGDRLRLPPA